MGEGLYFCGGGGGYNGKEPISSKHSNGVGESGCGYDEASNRCKGLVYSPWHNGKHPKNGRSKPERAQIY